MVPSDCVWFSDVSFCSTFFPFLEMGVNLVFAFLLSAHIIEGEVLAPVAGGVRVRLLVILVFLCLSCSDPCLFNCGSIVVVVRLLFDCCAIVDVSYHSMAESTRLLVAKMVHLSFIMLKLECIW